MNKQLEPDYEDLDAIFGVQKPEINTDILDEEVLDNPNIAPAPTQKRDKVSFNEPIRVEPVLGTPKPNKRRFIIKRTPIDKFSVKAQRVELTPSVCDICGFDVAEKAFGHWNRVPSDQKEIVQTAVGKHKQVVHTTAEQLIIDEDQMPTKWLGGGRL